MGQILVRSPTGQEDVHTLGRENSLGRGTSNSVVIDDPEVSRRQTSIVADPDGTLVATDLGSANGTLLNGRSLVVPTPIGPGDVLQLGTTEITVLGEASPPPRPDLPRGDTTSLRKDADSGVLVGRSPAMKEVFRLIRKAAESDIPVLIEGETGTGKELVARSIHQSSRRSDGPFIAVNCAAMPESLLESELFGHRRGAFTGATSDRAGLIEAAGGGTLFLDEIGEAPTALQPKLLRALQEGEVIRVGENQPRKVDFRLIAATNRSLLDEVENGAFRADLYYRIATLPMPVPSLRSREGDVEVLADIFLNAAMRRTGKKLDGFDDEARRAMTGFNWPGNVRELQNEVERAVALADAGERLSVAHLSPKIGAGPMPSEGPTTAIAGDTPESPQLRGRTDEFERQEIVAALERNGGTKTQAARELGITRQGLLKKMRRLGMLD